MRLRHFSAATVFYHINSRVSAGLLTTHYFFRLCFSRFVTRQVCGRQCWTSYLSVTVLIIARNAFAPRSFTPHVPWRRRLTSRKRLPNADHLRTHLKVTSRATTRNWGPKCVTPEPYSYSEGYVHTSHALHAAWTDGDDVKTSMPSGTTLNISANLGKH